MIVIICHNRNIFIHHHDILFFLKKMVSSLNSTVEQYTPHTPPFFFLFSAFHIKSWRKHKSCTLLLLLLLKPLLPTFFHFIEHRVPNWWLGQEISNHRFIKIFWDEKSHPLEISSNAKVTFLVPRFKISWEIVKFPKIFLGEKSCIVD